MNAAEAIHKALRDDHAGYFVQPCNWMKHPTVREHAGYLLTRPNPLAAWSREAPESHGWWGDVRDWILRATGQADQIIDPSRTQSETDAILRASVRDECRCGASLSAHEKTTADGDCFGCRADRRKGGDR